MASMYKAVMCICSETVFENYIDHKTEYVEVQALNMAVLERHTL